MKLTYFRDPRHANFGDDLNAWMWPKLLKNFFDDNEDIIFVGIGSIIGKKRPDHLEYKPHQKKIVFGSGFVAGYHEKPDLHDGTWDVFFVRGPRTASTFGLDKQLALGDSAILLRALVDCSGPNPNGPIGYVPHWESMERGNWEQVCKLAGMKLIDPRGTVEEVLDQIRQCRFLITEAMHGAIVGDALRVPWIAIAPQDSKHRDKWFDWAEALDIKLQTHYLPPSTINEVRAKIRHKKLLHLFVYALYKSPIAALVNRRLTAKAAQQLKEISHLPTSLSSDAAIEAATRAMQEKVDLLIARYGKREAA